MGAMIKKDIIFKYRITYTIMSQKYGAECSVNVARTTPLLRTHILYVTAGRQFGQLYGSN